MRMFLLAASAVLLLGAACSDPRKALDDDAACPGETCTDDTRDRLRAVAALDGVTEVELVSRTYSFDDGPAREARLRGSVESRADARSLLLEVLRELEEWPEHAEGTATATVTADPAVVVDYRHCEQLELPSGQFEACAGAQCDAALAEVGDRVAADYDGVEVTMEVRGGVLRAAATTTPGQVGLVAAAIERHLVGVGVRVAERAVIDVGAEGPLSMTLRLDDGVVCEQPLGMHVLCDADDPGSVPFEQAQL